MPPSYQQAFEESVDDNCEDNELGHVSSKRKQMLSAAKNNSTKQEVSHQVNPNTSPQQCVKYHQFRSPEKKKGQVNMILTCVLFGFILSVAIVVWRILMRMKWYG